jgi:hypothetical protein
MAVNFHPSKWEEHPNYRTIACYPPVS